MKWLVLLVLTALSAAAQQRDFLTADEADQIRLAQDPNIRIQVYLHFARQRMDLVEQALKKEKAGRAGLIHGYLDEYTKIIEAIDIVIDDALRRKVVIDEGIKALAKGEKELLDKLTAIADAKPRDAERYEFALTQAVDATRDSLELTEQDLSSRAADAAAREQQRRKELEDLRKPVEGEAKADVKTDAEKRAAEASTPESEKKGARKPPTLRRKGESAAPPKP